MKNVSSDGDNLSGGQRKKIGCNVSSAAAYDGRSRGIYDSIPTGGAYIYSHLW